MMLTPVIAAGYQLNGRLGNGTFGSYVGDVRACEACQSALAGVSMTTGEGKEVICLKCTGCTERIWFVSHERVDFGTALEEIRRHPPGVDSREELWAV